MQRCFQAASQALLDQVFVDTVEGSFDTDPTLTRGIGDFGFRARIKTPYDLAPLSVMQPSFFAATAVNTNAGDFVEVPGGSIGASIDVFDTKILENLVYAVWRFAPAPEGTVPEPGSLLLLGTGGMLLVVSRRRRLHCAGPK